MTALQRTAQLFGWVFVGIAIWGAFVAGTSMEADPDTAPRLLGLFPVNFLHNLVHLVIGLWGIRAAGSPGAARVFALGSGVLYLLLAGAGILTPTGFGFVPLGGGDIGLHALLGVILLVAGVTLVPRATDPEVEPAGTRTVLPPGASSTEGTVTRPPAQPEEPGEPQGP